ncbi:MAG TPA: type II toxin-antitoxin system RelE/ParE family toxin [Terracidiphilus sp.]|nr:type II toxin-antitoxin system RelE/ParE family toxin [Terracidiphilus sp.]
MTYRVDLTARAEHDLAMLYARVDAEHAQAAAAWYRRLKKSILSLEQLPERCPVTPENRRLRHLLFGRKPNVYRVIFRILEKSHRIEVLHIRHGARRSIRGEHRG